MAVIDGVIVVRSQHFPQFTYNTVKVIKVSLNIDGYCHSESTFPTVHNGSFIARSN